MGVLKRVGLRTNSSEARSDSKTKNRRRRTRAVGKTIQLGREYEIGVMRGVVGYDSEEEERKYAEEVARKRCRDGCYAAMDLD